MIISFFLSFSLNTAAQPLKIGDTIPDIEIDNIINSTSTKINLSHLKGKVILLDFWATWCKPCLQGFPKLESLQNNNSNKLQVIAISREPSSRLEKFLKNRPINVMVASDTLQVINQFFPHIWLPHAVLIDGDGVVRAITDGENITKEVLQAVIKKQTPSISVKMDDLSFNPETYFTPSEQTVSDFKITSHAKGGGAQMMPGEGVFKDRRWTYINVLFINLFQNAYGFNNMRTKKENIDKAELEYVPNNQYCVDIIVEKPGVESIRKELQKHLAQHFNYKARIEKRKDSVFVLRKIDRTSELLVKVENGGKNNWWGSRGKFNGSGIRLSKVGEYLEQFNLVKKPVIDETGDIQYYDVQVKWEHEKTSGVQEFVTSLGLELVPAIREYEVLIIYK